jgi:hypothetical protein
VWVEVVQRQQYRKKRTWGFFLEKKSQNLGFKMSDFVPLQKKPTIPPSLES